jgi:phosphoserine phosphatase
LTALVGLSLAEIVLRVLAPWALAVVIDHALGSAPLSGWAARVTSALGRGTTRRELLIVFASIGLTLQLAHEVVVMVHGRISVAIGQGLIRDLRERLFAHVQALTLNHHAATPTGDAVNRLEVDTRCIEQLVMRGLFPVVFSLITLITMFGVLATIAGALAVLPSPGSAQWLFNEVAVDIPFTGSEDIKAVEARLRQARGDLPIDIVVQPAALRRKKLFLADMDSTMIGQECIDELADFAGLRAHVAAITERAMRGEIEFEPALRERVALLKGMPVSVVDAVLAKRITPTSGGRELVMTMRAHGAYTCLISGGFTLFTNAVAAMIGFQENRANELLVADGKLTGEVREPVLGRAAKLATLVELRESFDLDNLDTLVVGDGANDLGMIESAGLGVAYHAKPAVAAAAAVRIDHGDLTALLYAQGYRRDEFVG